MTRAKRIKNKEESTDTLAYPGPEEYNEPPDSFDEYMRCIYGPKGSGKSTAVASTPNSLTLMFEPKRKGLRIRQLALQKYSAKEIIDGAPDLWVQVKNTTPEWINDPTIECLNYDSVDIFYESCYHSVCASHGHESPGDAGRSSSDIWNEIRDEFASYFDALRDTNMGINLTSHVKEREEATLEGGKMGYAAPSCSPACLKYIKQAADIVLFYGWYQGERAMMVRDDTNSSFVAPGVEGKFLQPDGKPISIFRIPNIDLESGTSIYQTMKDAFDNKLWDVDTPEEQRTTTKPTPKKKGPPKRRPPR